MILYHGASRINREAIMLDGLIPGSGLSNEGMLGEGITHAIFLTPDSEEAGEYGEDIWMIDAESLSLIVIDGPNGYHYASLSPIPPSLLTLI